MDSSADDFWDDSVEDISGSVGSTVVLEIGDSAGRNFVFGSIWVTEESSISCDGLRRKIKAKDAAVATIAPVFHHNGITNGRFLSRLSNCRSMSGHKSRSGDTL